MQTEAFYCIRNSLPSKLYTCPSFCNTRTSPLHLRCRCLHQRARKRTDGRPPPPLLDRQRLNTPQLMVGSQPWLHALDSLPQFASVTLHTHVLSKCTMAVDAEIRDRSLAWM